MVRSLALLLTVLTGFSGLVYEVAWQKSFAILLGSHSEATAAVLGIFLGGLALGYASFGRLCHALVERGRRAGRPPRLLLLYGVVEGAIGAWALLFPPLFAGVRALSVSVPQGAEAVAFGVDVALTALLIGPPTVLMGGTIPILTQALARSLRDATRFHAFVYGFNTAGAFAGAVAAGFFLIPLLGVDDTVRAMGLVNAFAGGVFVLLGAGGRSTVALPTRAREPRLAGFRTCALAAALLGFAMMSVQTVLIRLGGLAFGASHFTFAMVVAAFVLCIALGSLAVSALERIPRAAVAACPLALTALLALLYGPLEDAPYYAHALRSLFRDVEAAFYPYYLSASVGILLVLALPVGLSGASLPLLFHELRREVGELGGVAGRLYSWNTVGNLLGALLGGYALLFWLDLHHVYRLAVAAVGVAGVILAARIHRLPRVPLAIAAACGLGALAALEPWDPARLTAGFFRSRAPKAATYRGPDAAFRALGEKTLRFFDDDPTTTVSALEHKTPEGGTSLAIVTNGKSDGSLVVDYPTMALIALVPCLLADACTDAFVIGYGTGTTVGELAALASMENVVVAEISRGVLEAAPLFDYGNQGASRSEKVRLVRSDAYRALLRSRDRFDLIASEPSNPWVSGVEMLYSREFLEAARERLEPGGVYAQWFHTYETDQATVELVLRTYASVFDRVAVWYTFGPDLMLLGFADDVAGLDLGRIERRMARPDFAAGLKRAGIESLPALLAHEILPLGVLHAASLAGDVHTLLHPLLSHRAARAFFVGRSAELPTTARPEEAEAGARNSLLRAWIARQEGRLSDAAREQMLDEACDARGLECAALLAHWRFEEADSPTLARRLEEARRNPVIAPHVRPQRMHDLTSFFGDGPTGRALTPEAARQQTELFARYYHHGVPFRRAALQRIWNACRGPRCVSARREAEALVGPLAAPARAGS